ncbi:glycosyltransferase [Myroides odoratimimus]|uniref:glycosyltransferase n=1 Tax=Myroides odoratimimus TaxID=76832 RepID=UPI0031013215
MKILHYINNLGSGGAEKLLVEILPLFIRESHDVTLVLSNSFKSVKLYEDSLKAHGVKVISLNKSFYNPMLVWDISRILSKGQFDIVHAHLFPSQYWLAFASIFVGKKTKFIKTEHSVFNERKNYFFLKPLERFVYSRYKGLIGITDEVTKNLQDWLKRTSGFVTINNGVNIDAVITAKEYTNIENYNFLKKENFNILMVGRFDGAQKDQRTLVLAMKHLPENVMLYFAGEGDYRVVIESLVRDEGLVERVHFLGMRTDVYSIMNLVDLNVLSSNHEGLSGVVLESLASSSPFLGSNVVGIKDVVPNQSFLFERGNVLELVDKVNKLLIDESFYRKLVEEGNEGVKKYDISNMSRNYLDFYTRVLNE